MKSKRKISLLIALMMLLTMLAVPSLAYGKSSYRIAATSHEGYYIGNETGKAYDEINMDYYDEDYKQLYLCKDNTTVDTLPSGWYWDSTDEGVVTVSVNGEATVQSEEGMAEIHVKDSSGISQASAPVYVGSTYYIKLMTGEFKNDPYDDQEGQYTTVGLGQSINLCVCHKYSDKEIDQTSWKWDFDSWDDSQNVSIEKYVEGGNEKGVTVTGKTKGIVRLYATQYDNEEEIAYAGSVTVYVGGACEYYAVDTERENTYGFLEIGASRKVKVVSVPETSIDQTDWNWYTYDYDEGCVSISGNTITAVKESEDSSAINCYAESNTGNSTYDYCLKIESLEWGDDYFDCKIYPGKKTAKIIDAYDNYDESYDSANLAIPDAISVEGSQYDIDGRYTVNAIDDGALFGKDWIKSVRIPNSITAIGNYAMGYYENDHLDRYEKYPNFVIYGYSASSAAAKYAAANGFSYINLASTPPVPAKKNQTISGASSITKSYGSKDFSLGAAATGNGPLTYSSSNAKVVTVNSSGSVTIKGTGIAKITITASATQNYNAASKTVTINITPQKVTRLKAKAAKKKMTVSWKKDTKASGYQITYAQNKKFSKGKKNVNISKNKTTKKVIKKLKSKKTYYVKVRAYKKVSGKKLYGAYSGVKRVKIK